MLKIYAIIEFPWPSVILVISGFISFLWAMIRTEKKDLMEKFLDKIFQTLGFFWGVTVLVWGVYTLGSKLYPEWTGWMMIVIGLSLFLKPIKDIPWASLVSLLVSSSMTGLLALNLSPVLFFGFDIRWILAVVFLCLLFTLYIFLKFIEDLFKIIGTFLSSDPVSFLLGSAGLILGAVSVVVV